MFAIMSFCMRDTPPIVVSCKWKIVVVYVFHRGVGLELKLLGAAAAGAHRGRCDSNSSRLNLAEHAMAMMQCPAS